MKIHFLPARFGDAIIIDWESPDGTKRMLIDGGTKGTRHDIRDVLEDGVNSLELAVVSHIDRDHIEGLLAMLEEPNPGFTTRDLWFNSFHHLPEPPDEDEEFSAIQGERLTAAIIAKAVPWNTDFQGDAVVVPDNGDLPSFNLNGGMEVTLLSPSNANLMELYSKWNDEVKEANLVPGFGAEVDDTEPDFDDESFDAVDIPDVSTLANQPFTDDESPANRSSIAFIVEHDNKRALMAGDACMDTLVAGLERFSPGTVVEFDLIKIPHHGSPHNISKEFIDKVNCKRWMFSSNGSIFNHPKEEAVARVIEFVDKPELIFNYRSEENAIWEESAIQQMFDYSTIYPPLGKKGIAITL